MVLLKEFRIVMPLTVAEYRIGQLWTIAHFSKNETGGGDGIEILANEPFTNKPLLGTLYSTGQYTKKKFYGQKKVHGMLRKLMPASALIAEEESWNAYPYTRTIITNEFLGERFHMKIESLHLPGKANHENVHLLTPDQLKHLEVIIIDIAAPLADLDDYDRKLDPAKFKSSKTGRGKLQPGWMEKTQPLMTCYKLVTIEFKWFGLQTMIEHKIHSIEHRLFTLFNRELFCRIDRWHGMSLEQIRQYEDQVKEELKKARRSLGTRGFKGN